MVALCQLPPPSEVPKHRVHLCRMWPEMNKPVTRQEALIPMRVLPGPVQFTALGSAGIASYLPQPIHCIPEKTSFSCVVSSGLAFQSSSQPWPDLSAHS